MKKVSSDDLSQLLNWLIPRTKIGESFLLLIASSIIFLILLALI